MLVKELISALKKADPKMEIAISSDEDLTTIYRVIEIVKYQSSVKPYNLKYVLFGLSGTEESNDASYCAMDEIVR